MGKIFNKGLDKEEDKKEGLFKRLENIKDKNEELLDVFTATNKVSKAPKHESNYNYDSNYTFYEFYKELKKFKKRSLGSKYDDMTDFYELLNSFINTHKATTDETNNRKNIILSYVKPLYNNYLDVYKRNYDNKKLTDEDKINYDYKQFEIIDNRDQGLKSTPKKTDEIQKPLWAKINKNDFDSLIQNVYNNLNNNEFKTTVDKKNYDLKK